MTNGKCPNCGAESVYVAEQGIRYERGYLHLDGLGDGLKDPTPYQSYVCTKCGHFENYILDEAKLQAIEGKWKKVG